MNKIYILEINGTYKIGRTKNIKQRLRGLQTAVPEKIKVVNEYIVENNIIIERYIHHLLRKHRIRGEFFNCSIEHIRNVIDKIMDMEMLNNNDDKDNKDNKDYKVSRILKYTSQVVKNRINLLYVHNQWYLFNTVSGIYEYQRDDDVIEIIDNLFYDTDDWSKWVKNIDYKKNLVEELKTKCIIPKNVSLDESPYLLGFSNGVFDLSTNEFRPGLASEYISMNCKYPYNTNIDTALAHEILDSTFSDPDERQFAINQLSLILDGGNSEQTLTFNYGFTSTGKSFLMERLCSLMGDYGNSFNVNLLTTKMKNAGDANSTLINFKNKRFSYCSEPESGAKLNTNFVKMLTGDIIKARGVYSRSDEAINPSYSIFICCNALPEFDKGIARRIFLLEYSTKFTENPKRHNERRIKKYNREELELIERGLMKILIDNYKVLKSNEFKYSEPKKLTILKNLYINTSKDDIKNILLEKFEVGVYTDLIKLKDIKTLLKTNGFDKDTISIKYLVQEIFSIKFTERIQIHNNQHKNVFLNLKYITR
jgi:hypothetical protein